MKRHPLLQRLSFLMQLVEAEHPALTDGVSSLTYAELITAVEDVAAWLARQNARVVALRADNSLNWVVTDLACQVANAVALPIPSFFTNEQQQHCLQQAGADLLLTDQPDRSEISLGSHTTPHDLTLSLKSTQRLLGIYAWRLPVDLATRQDCPAQTGKITFTSGSTGTPKGVCLSNEHQWQVAESLADVIDLQAPRHLCLLPLATLLENIAGVYTPLLCRGTVILPDAQLRGLSGSSGLDAQAMLTAMHTYQPSSLILLPQLLSVLVAACESGWKPPVSLKFIAVGGSRVAPSLLHKARGCGLPVYEGYGLSECGSVVALNTPRANQPGSVGRVLPHCQVEEKEGELVVSGATFLGYLGQPDSWYQLNVKTGDLGSLDDGWLHIQGRLKNLLITAFGRNVSPEWVESALSASHLLTRCVVVGDARPHLSVLLTAPAAVTDQQLGHWIDHVNTELPDYARIGAWHRLDDKDWTGLITANGRPKRQLIEEHFSKIIDGLYSLTD